MIYKQNSKLVEKVLRRVTYKSLRSSHSMTGTTFNQFLQTSTCSIRSWDGHVPENSSESNLPAQAFPLPLFPSPKNCILWLILSPPYVEQARLSKGFEADWWVDPEEKSPVSPTQTHNGVSVSSLPRILQIPHQMLLFTLTSTGQPESGFFPLGTFNENKEVKCKGLSFPTSPGWVSANELLRYFKTGLSFHCFKLAFQAW